MRTLILSLLLIAGPAAADGQGSFTIICRGGKPVAIQIITTGPGVAVAPLAENLCPKEPARAAPKAPAPVASSGRSV